MRVKNILTILAMPIIAGNPSWGVPENVAELIWKERKQAINGNLEEEYLEKATLAEVTACLYGLSLAAPLDSDYTKIYLYSAGKTAERMGTDLPNDMKVNLSKYRKGLLLDFAKEIRRKAILESVKRLRDLKRLRKYTKEKLAERLYFERFGTEMPDVTIEKQEKPQLQQGLLF